MKKNKNLKFWTADISVRRGIRRYFMTGGLYNGKRYFEFKKEDDFMDFLLKIKGVVFFHHLDFDIRFILDWFRKKEIKFEKIPIVARGKVIEWKQNNLILRDTFILTNSSIKDLAESFGLKLKQNFKNDIILFHRILTRFYNFLGRQYFEKKSIASIGLAKFKEIDKNNYFKIVDSSIFKKDEQFIREGFFSAYYKVFNPDVIAKDKNKIIKLDCNSYYGSMMRENLFPYGNLIRAKGKEQIQNLIDQGKLGMVKAQAFCPKKLPLGILPQKTKDGVNYPTRKKIYGIWTTPEIEFAKQYDYNFNFKTAIFWEFKDFLFKRYINYLAKIKEKSKGAKREIAKTLLVSFYGKFAQRREIEKYTKVKTPILNRLYLDKELTIMAEKKYVHIPTSHPEISAFTTNYARIWIWKLCEMIGWKTILAILSDSLIIKDNLTPEFKEKWFDPNKIGKFKLVGEIKKGIFLARGVYALKLTDGTEIIKNQGGLKEYTKLLTFKDFEKAKRRKIWVQYDKKTGIEKPKSIREFLKGKGKLKEENLITRKIKIRS